MIMIMGEIERWVFCTALGWCVCVFLLAGSCLLGGVWWVYMYCMELWCYYV